ncbi:MAG: prenyltransferase/squalene oxidase repeat-containing protein [Planctomycetota bacterium]
MLCLLLLSPLLALQGPSDKELFDSYLNRIRPAQMADGSYGGNVVITADVLTGMALSPRAYRVDDGPFVRDAVTYLLAHADERKDDWARDERLALALMHVHQDRYLPTVQKLLRRHGHQLSELQSTTPAAGTPFTLRNLPQDAGLAQTARALADAGILRTYGNKNKSAPSNHPDAAALSASYERGVDFLIAARGASGVWEFFGQPEPGISALAARALFGSSNEKAHKIGYEVLDFLLTLQKEDGSIHAGRVAVYTTSVAVGALVDGGREADIPAIQRAVAYLRSVQTDEGEGYSEADKFYGGIGYGGDLRPDLSNLQYALQALKDADVPAEDQAFQRAIHFLNRSQNRSESNPETYQDKGDPTPVRAGNDGGAVYYPGNSPAGTVHMPDGSLVARSYGSMTYALLKCFLFAGVPKEDPRVVAAVGWISAHWTLEVNPGFDPMVDPRGGFQGLYYYYLSLAQALDAAEIEVLESAGGVQHVWREELGAKLIAVQQEDGHWVNQDAPRWWEGNPVLCTAYALGAMRVVQK